MFRQFFCGNIKIIFNSLLYFFIESIFLSNTLSNILSNILSVILSVILGITLSITLGIMVSDTPHYKNEVPFEVPEGWVWTTINDICSKIGSGSTPRGSNYAEKGIPFFRSQNVYNDGLVYDDIKYITEDVHKMMIGTEVRANDLLLNITGGSLGRCAIVPNEFCKGNVSQHVCILRTIIALPAYLHLFIISDYFAATMILSGSGREGLPKYSLEIMQFPLPPLTEQHRIVAAVEQWFSLIDTLESAKEDLQTSIVQAKSKILDLAIHGKLVPQDPSDEPAIGLLKRINPKFVPCDNAHYENVPSNWTAILLGDLCFTINGLWKGKKPPFVNVGVIRNANFTKDCKLDYSNIAYLEVEAKQYEKRKLQYGDIIVEKSGGSDNQPVGRTILFEKTEGDYSFSNFTSVLRIYDGYPALPEYLNMYLQAVYQTGITKRMQTQTTGIHNLIFDQFLAITIELPPLVEQHRIINKVNELFQILDNISAEL